MYCLQYRKEKGAFKYMPHENAANDYATYVLNDCIVCIVGSRNSSLKKKKLSSNLNMFKSTENCPKVGKFYKFRKMFWKMRFEQNRIIFRNIENRHLLCIVMGQN